MDGKGRTATDAGAVVVKLCGGSELVPIIASPETTGNRVPDGSATGPESRAFGFAWFDGRKLDGFPDDGGRDGG